MTFFSIIIATYNVESEISKTLYSICNYKLKEKVDIIIIDGGSNDKTLNEISKFEPILSIKVLSEPDKGIYDAWNKGINLASGEWLIFLGAGDTINEEWLLCVERFSNQNFHNLNNAVVAGYSLIQTPLLQRKLLMRTKGNYLNQTIEFVNTLKLPYLHSGSANQKSLFDKQKFNSDFKILGDLEFINRVKPIIYFLDCEQCYYSFGGMSSSPLTAKRQIEEYTAIAKLYSISIGWSSKIRFFVRTRLSSCPFLYNLIWEIYLAFKCKFK
jgi:glycosyltransferase involved in cell wall biosynthesis